MADRFSSLVSLVILINAASSSAADCSWWQTSVFYQIYPRSYQDSDNNGIGDIKGIIEHVDYLNDLGVTGIWMNPIYNSPLKDFGYDISNYTSIDPTFGTFDDFTALVDKLHGLGMRILVDLVPNHSSNKHPWFVESENGNEEFKDFYVWQSGTVNENGSRSPPNNWPSVMGGGSGWQWSDKRQEYYYHAFLAEQPDLNYRNPDVLEAMKSVMKFWLDLGADGFRVDAVQYLVEDDQLRNDPYVQGCTPVNSSKCFDPIYTKNLPETFEVLSQFKQLLDQYNNPYFPGEKFMIVEVDLNTDMKIVMNYFEYNGKRVSSMPFNFDLISITRESNGTQVKELVDSWTNNLIKDGWSNWVIGNHDQKRISHKVGEPMTDGMNMIVLLLPGTSFSYYGEELGMDYAYVFCFKMQDTQAIRQAGTDCSLLEKLSRDPERTPMQWNSSLNAGFSAHKPWLPVNPDFFAINVENQMKYDKSHLNIYKRLISLKNEMQGCKSLKTLAPAEGWVFAFERTECVTGADKYVVLVNFNDEEVNINLSQDFQEDEMVIRVASQLSPRSIGERISLDNLSMRPKEGLVLALSDTSNQI